MGALYQSGGAGLGGITVDPLEAIAWYSKAAAQNSPQAELDLGWLYYLGVTHAGVTLLPADFAKAAFWFEKASALGDPRSQQMLGMMHAKGQTFKPDYAAANAWFQKSAAQGFAAAEYDLGVMYGFGNGIPKDNVQALDNYRKSAAKGFPLAQNQLGFFYETGKDVPQDNIVASALYWLSSPGISQMSTQPEWSAIYSQAITEATSRLHTFVQTATKEQQREGMILAQQMKTMGVFEALQAYLKSKQTNH